MGMRPSSIGLALATLGLWTACAKGDVSIDGGPGGPDAPIGGNPDAPVGGNPDAPVSGGADAAPMTRTLAHNTSDAITAGNSAACNNGTGHEDNRYFRVFDLPTLGINSAFQVTGVTFGVEEAIGAVGSQSVTLRLHTLNGAPLLANLSQIATTTTSVPDQTATLVNASISATAPAGSKLVFEVFTPGPATSGNLMFIGSNAGGQSAPGYIYAPATGCDITEMTDLAVISFPSMHMVMKVTGTYNP